MADRLRTDADLGECDRLAARLRNAEDADCAALAAATTDMAAELRRLRGALHLIAAEVQRVPSALYNSDPTVNRVVDNIAALAARAGAR